LIEDPDRRERMGALGRIKAERYRWPEVASRVLDFYARTASRPEPAVFL
jgi:glycosyltransferase involved in cell wall biosynthesis